MLNFHFQVLITSGDIIKFKLIPNSCFNESICFMSCRPIHPTLSCAVLTFAISQASGIFQSVQDTKQELFAPV